MLLLPHWSKSCLLLAACGAAVFLAGPTPAQPAKTPKLLRIGTSGSLGGDADAGKDQTATDTLRSFIKNETGFDSDLVTLKDWQEVAGKLAKGDLQVGVFQGAEFAWAQDKDAQLVPLTLAVNVQRYRYAHVLVRQSETAKDMAALKGKSLSLPRVGQSLLKLYLERQCQAQGAASPEAFFGKISHPDNIEDSLDDVVDGTVQVAVVDRVGLEAYKRRKPGRAAQLREVARSGAFPPPIIAARGDLLDAATRKRFQDGLLTAHTKEKERRLLSLFKLTAFEAPPPDFKQFLADFRKAYPAPTLGGTEQPNVSSSR